MLHPRPRVAGPPMTGNSLRLHEGIEGGGLLDGSGLDVWDEAVAGAAGGSALAGGLG